MRQQIHWTYFGLKERGTVDKLWLKCMGVRTSRDKATIPQISKDEYLEALQQAGFCERTAVVMHTDSAPTFTSRWHAGIVDSHSVNHGEHEYVRSVSILANVFLGLISFFPRNGLFPGSVHLFPLSISPSAAGKQELTGQPLAPRT